MSLLQQTLGQCDAACPEHAAGLHRRALGVSPDSPTMARQQQAESTTACLVCRANELMIDRFYRSGIRGDEAEAVWWIAARLRQSSSDQRNRVRWWWATLLAWIQLACRPVELATACILLLTAGAAVEQNLFDRAPVLRAPSGLGVALRSVHQARLAAPGVPDTLCWSPVANASYYLVELRDGSGAIHWATRATSPSALIPAAVRSRLARFEMLRWRVVSKSALGRILWIEERELPLAVRAEQ